MMWRTVLAMCVVGAMCGVAAAERLSDDEIFIQVSSNAGDCSTCHVRIAHLTPHLVLLGANNDWVGVGFYDEASDTYRGQMEWLEGRGQNFEGVLFQFTLRHKAGTIAVTATSPKGTIETSYRRQPVGSPLAK